MLQEEYNGDLTIVWGGEKVCGEVRKGDAGSGKKKDLGVGRIRVEDLGSAGVCIIGALSCRVLRK